ncbi:MAG TPA: alpha/beta hydrolase [Xanthobacteraceae bacterium]|jgi:pimeloyl-ACP methyl ester carboxylesterase
MRLLVDGVETYAGTGGRDLDRAQPLMLFLHGAALDHTVWALLARYFAHHGFAVLAPDLPGHGRSGGEPICSIAAMADWTARLIAAAGSQRAILVGHSMGSLIALEAAARHPAHVAALALIGSAPTMPVSAALLAAAEANDHAAIDMLGVWGYGFRAGIGGSLAPGLWMLGGAQRLWERARPGVLFRDLSACNAYTDGIASAARVTVPALLILGERDLMTPVKSGMQLAAALPDARVVTLKAAGHILMSERPDEVLAALRSWTQEVVGRDK